MRIPFVLLMLVSLFACDKYKERISSVELITSDLKKDSLFKGLVKLTFNSIPESMLQDSLAFLVLPVQAICPSCREKTVDSIVKYQHHLPDKHFIIISANGGRKLINSFFKEEHKRLPVIEGKLFLDSTNMAHRYELYEDKPTMYYTYRGKAYKKVSSMPATVRKDLHQFFSGNSDLQ
ncbi:hypothetical protein [Chitinophaga sp. CF418]|uniref:hypothetical protein n=1 Tax=Chitinophaga sp. CF418 TaxID=1855287 RepID=UPI000922CD96|nr:hypothetical protein [Chitinophaga sp. CF418]SHM37046.1 hypothetical protein SAMN05216311_10226 [Chitinophaga sp. CF418]